MRKLGLFIQRSLIGQVFLRANFGLGVLKASHLIGGSLEILSRFTLLEKLP